MVFCKIWCWLCIGVCWLIVRAIDLIWKKKKKSCPPTGRGEIQCDLDSKPAYLTYQILGLHLGWYEFYIKRIFIFNFSSFKCTNSTFQCNIFLLCSHYHMGLKGSHTNFMETKFQWIFWNIVAWSWLIKGPQDHKSISGSFEFYKQPNDTYSHGKNYKDKRKVASFKNCLARKVCEYFYHKNTWNIFKQTLPILIRIIWLFTITPNCYAVRLFSLSVFHHAVRHTTLWIWKEINYCLQKMWN